MSASRTARNATRQARSRQKARNSSSTRVLRAGRADRVGGDQRVAAHVGVGDHRLAVAREEVALVGPQREVVERVRRRTARTSRARVLAVVLARRVAARDGAEEQQRERRPARRSRARAARPGRSRSKKRAGVLVGPVEPDQPGEGRLEHAAERSACSVDVLLLEQQRRRSRRRARARGRPARSATTVSSEPGSGRARERVARPRAARPASRARTTTTIGCGPLSTCDDRAERRTATSAACQARCLPRASCGASRISARPTSTEATWPATRSDSSPISVCDPEPVVHAGQQGEQVEQAAERGQASRARAARARGARRGASARGATAAAPARRGRSSGSGERIESPRSGTLADDRPGARGARRRPGLGPHGREQDHLADRLGARDQHHQPVEADAEPAGRRQPVLERADVVLVDVLGLLVAGRLGGGLGLEARALVDRVVELGVGVGQLAAARRRPRSARPASGSSRCARASGETSRG